MKHRKLCAAFLLCAMLLCLFAGCGEDTAETEEETQAEEDVSSDETDEESSTGEQAEDTAEESSVSTVSVSTSDLEIPETDTSLYPLAEDATLTFWYGSWENDYVESIDELWNIQEAESITGVHIEYTTCSTTAETEATSLMYASGSYSDMINYMGTAYKGGHAAAVEDEIYLDLTDYVPEYAPNYYSIITSSEEIRRDVYSDEGMLIGFFQIASSIQPAFTGLYVRGDWLEELGLDAPTTYDELYDIMCAFRDNYGTSFGLSIDSSGITGALAYGLGFTATNPNNSGGWIVVDGEVQCSFTTEGFRTYLEYMSTWYAEDLINKDFISGTEEDVYLTDQCGVYVGMAEDIYDMPPQAEDPDFSLTPCPFLTETGTETVHLGDLGDYVGNAGVAITTECEDIELACRWLDFFYSEQGYMLNNYGQEGVTYTLDENGDVVYTELITDNPDGLTLMEARSLYTGSGAANRAWLYDWAATQIGSEEALQPTVDAWQTDGDYIWPQMATLTTEESEEASAYVSDCSVYWEEMTLKFIVGEVELNDETWAEYLDTLESMGLSKALESYQAALERYYER